jgi:hypothetical protein
MTPIPCATQTAVPSRAEPEVAQRARRRTARRLLPFLFLLYVIAFLDRRNVGAAALQMPQDLGFSEAVTGFGAGIFFLGYFLLEVPGALIVERWGVRRWMARIMITWGLMTVLMAFTHTSRQFSIVRFLVGAAEAGFLPGVIVYLTYRFPHQDRAKSVAFFYAANPLCLCDRFAPARVAAGALVARNERMAMVVHYRRNSGSSGGCNHSLVPNGLAVSGRLASRRRETADYHRVAAGEGGQKASPFLQRGAGAAPSGRDPADRVLPLRHDWQLRDCVLAPHYSEAPLGKERSQGNAVSGAPIHSRVYRPKGEWLALRRYSRTPLARCDSCFPVRAGACIGGYLQQEPAGLHRTFRRRGWIVVWLPSLPGSTHYVSERVGCRRLHRTHQLGGQSRRICGADGWAIPATAPILFPQARCIW